MYILRKVDDNGGGIPRKLGEAKRAFSECGADLGLFGECRRRLLIKVAVFELPRPCGCWVVWGFLSNYSALGLRMRRGCGDWLVALCPAWGKHCAGLGVHCELLKGNDGRGQHKQKKKTEHDVAPWSISSAGLFAVLSRLASPPRIGGFVTMVRARRSSPSSCCTWSRRLALESGACPRVWTPLTELRHARLQGASRVFSAIGRSGTV